MDDLISPLRVVSLRDPALDLAQMNAEQYMLTRDASLVRTLPGRTPVWHTLRALTLADEDALASQPQAMIARRAYELALSQVEGCERLSPGGLAWRPARTIEGPDGRSRPAPTYAEMDALCRALPHGREDMVELGLVALERATQGNGDRGVVNYMAPPLLSDVVARSARLRAGQTPGTSATPT